MLSHPAFRGTPLDSPITKIGLPLIAVRPNETGQLPGSACLVAPWFAMTARHVIEDFAPAPPGSEHHIFTQVVTDGGKTVLPLRVHRVFYRQPYDIAFLHLVPAAEIPSEHVWECPELEPLPPKVGSRIVAFGYPKSRMREATPDRWEVYTDATTTTGMVLEVHHEARDRTKPFPCFRTDARFDPGMSGGPVLNEQGRVCGIICSNMPPHQDGAEHVSYVSTLWPAMGTMVDLEWDGRHKPGTFYPVYEMAKAGIIHARDLDSVVVIVRGDGTQTVHCRRYDC